MINLNRLIDIFLELIRIEATSKSEKPVADYIRSFIKPLGLSASEDQAGQIVGGNTGNIIISLNSNNTPDKVAFMAHMDTIKSTRGINARIEDGVIHTDGNTILGADNRAGIAIILYMIEYIKTQRIKHLPFEAIFTIGEETGLFGSTHLDLSKVHSRTAYILDSSADPGCYVFQSPSAVEFELIFSGKASHAAVQPKDGINALSMAASFINAIDIGQVDPETTINIGKICGGEANNVIPSRIDLTGEIRSFNPDRIEEYLDRIRGHLSSIRKKYGGNFDLSTNVSFPGFELSPDSSAIRRLNQSLEKNNLTPRPLKYHGGSDANILNNRGLTAIDMGIGAKNPHSVEEYIKIRDLEVIANVCLHLLIPET